MALPNRRGTTYPPRPAAAVLLDPALEDLISDLLPPQTSERLPEDFLVQPRRHLRPVTEPLPTHLAGAAQEPVMEVLVLLLLRLVTELLAT